MKKASKVQLKNDLWGWALASPLVLGLLIFTMFPIVLSIVYSFHDVNIIEPMKNFGLQNYTKLFNGESGKTFLHSLKVTFSYAIVSIPLGMFLGYMLAVFLHANVKGNKWLVVLYYLPTMIPAVVSGYVWGDMMNVRYGLFNNVLSRLGLETINFMSAGNLMKSYIWMTTFNTGGGTIMWLAGLNSVDKVYYEAATIDGANAFVKFFKITIPMTTSYIFYNLIMGIIGALQLFNQPYILTNGTGGEEDALLTVEMYIYETYRNFRIGEAAAMSWILCFIIAIMTGLAFLLKKKVYYADES